MERVKVEEILILMGIPTNIKGFEYIVDAMDIFDEKGTDISIVKDVYFDIAKKHNVGANHVMNAINRAFCITRSNRGNYEVVSKYIGFNNKTNHSSLTMLYKKIAQEFKKEEISSSKPEITVNDIRNIVRQELQCMLEKIERQMKEIWKGDKQC